MSGGRGGAPNREDDEKLSLSRHAALKGRRQGDILVLPERAIRLGGSGGEILHLFDRPRSANEIVTTLRERHPSSEELETDVYAFLTQLRRLGALVVDKMNGRGKDGARTGADRRAVAGGRALVPPSVDVGATPAPLNVIAELTYRCPLQCPYCSNPLDFRERREGLDADQWGRVFEEAAELGAVHLGLTGGEPSTRTDLEEILAHAIRADLYPHLVTAGRPLTPARLDDLAERGLRSVQVSIQAVDAALSDRIAGTRSFEEKLAIARRTVDLGLSLTINCVLHRQNLADVPRLIDLALELGADRLELANTQYHGWALRNRAALMPTRAQLDEASTAVESARERAAEQGLTILYVLPDYHSGRPKPCMGGWGRIAMVVDPTGLVLPCHEASDLPGLEFWRTLDHSLSDCWQVAPGMQAFRGTDWMGEPCRSCPKREIDFGGCRCQAYRLLGDATSTDPTCSLSPDHSIVAKAREEMDAEFIHRR